MIKVKIVELVYLKIILFFWEGVLLSIGVLNGNLLFLVIGIGFPTCVSINNCVCHFSPLHSEADAILKNSDMVKM